MTKHLTLTYHTDPGHGWLEVPRTEIDALGIAKQITAYSYEQGGVAYLEEDCDASLFVQAAKNAGIQITPVDRHVDRDHPIRRMARFVA